jgi:hypothetical protein
MRRRQIFAEKSKTLEALRDAAHNVINSTSERTENFAQLAQSLSKTQKPRKGRK